VAPPTPPPGGGGFVNFPKVNVDLTLNRRPENLWVELFTHAMTMQPAVSTTFAVSPPTVEHDVIAWVVPKAAYDQSLAALKASIQSANISYPHQLLQRESAQRRQAQRIDAQQDELAEMQRKLDHYNWT
jgi:hypothetical protein